MKKMALIALSACLALGAGCSRPASDSTVAATPTPQVVKGQIVREHTAVQPMTDQPIMAGSPSPSSTAPKP